MKNRYFKPSLVPIRVKALTSIALAHRRLRDVGVREGDHDGEPRV